MSALIGTATSRSLGRISFGGARASAIKLSAIRLFAVAALLLALVVFAPGFAQPADAQENRTRQPGQFLGVATCAGSTCHGRAEGNGEVVRQDEIATWQEPSSASGAHSRAYASLGSNRGRQIAASMGIGPATSAAQCLGCHSTNVAPAKKGPRFIQADGVGCESCHGPSGGWLASHYAKPATHQSNINNGLIPTDRPQVRAGVCLDCHYGSKESGQFVTHEMMAAGHPRVAFEVDLFSALMQHWDVDDDYIERKGRPDSVRMWAVGQAEAVRRQSDLFARPSLAQQGMFPEFYFYDCHSCHRTITDGSSRRLTFETNPGRQIPFGNAPFNDENMIMLSAAGKALAPGQAAAFDDASKAFHRAMGQNRSAAAEAAQRLRSRAGALSDALAARSYSGNDAFAIVAAIANTTTRARFTDYTGSAQAVMAVDTLLNAMVRDGRITVGAAAGIRADINRAYAAVRSPNSYSPSDFRASLGRATSAIGALR